MFPYRTPPSEGHPPGLTVGGINRSAARRVEESEVGKAPPWHAGERVLVRVVCSRCHRLVGTVASSAGGLHYETKVMVQPHGGRRHLAEVAIDLLDAGHPTFPGSASGSEMMAYCAQHGLLHFSEASLMSAVKRFQAAKSTQKLEVR